MAGTTRPLSISKKLPQTHLRRSRFEKKIDYERASTQVALARQAASDKQQQSLFAEAAAGFQRFAADQPNSPFQLQALATAGNLFSEQAVNTNNKAEKLPKAAHRQREALQETARTFLNQAKKPLETLLAECEAKLKALPKAAQRQKMRGSQSSRQQLEGKQAEARFLLAKLSFERSRTFDVGSQAQKKSLQVATAAFADLYRQYEDKLVGFYGRFYEGRSFQQAGDLKKALKCYEDIVDQPPIPNQDFRRLVARATRYRAECHLADNNVEKAIKECREWLDQSRGAELREPDWLAVSYQLATAYESKASLAGGKEAQRSRSEARKLYRQIAKNPGEFQRDAKARMASVRSRGKKPMVAKTFDEAFIAGKDAPRTNEFVKARHAGSPKKNNPSAVESLAEQVVANQTAATQYFLQATQLADDKTDPEQMVTARYYLCWLYWEEGRLEDAAAIGELLAKNYPENKYAPAAAKLALAAYERLYNTAKQTGKSTAGEAERLTQMAKLLATRWPESPEAAAALGLLINIALRDDRLADAEEMLQQIPQAGRAAAELRLGGAIWNRYLRLGANGLAGPDSLAVKKKAGQLLARGFESLTVKPQATAAEATGILYFAQFLLADGQAEKAIAHARESFGRAVAFD